MNTDEWRDVILETSLKPFRDLSEPGIRAVAEHLFVQWGALWRHSHQVSVLFWTSDGSEILEYDRDMERPLEWARYIGGANPLRPVPNDPELKALHSRNRLYCENPAVLNYEILKKIVDVVRSTGERITGRTVRIGTAFDPGPEFAKSRFKYEWHPEILMSGSAGQGDCRFATCYARLKKDSRRYAGFPGGIPGNTPLGTFLGRQCRLFCADLGFDYVWLSNGFGFGKEPWRMQGALFNEKQFDPSGIADQRRKILEFWDSFREECPDLPIEVRGTNLPAGVDLSTDATPYLDLLCGRYGFSAPPNSPWAAIDGDFGLELAGYMTRIAELPADRDGFPFRFYIHDPWWLNSPWLERYDRQPHDIYLPMSISRITEEGSVQTADVVEFLTADDSLGRMPDQVPDEVIPHIREAARHRPDSPGPLIWVYPLAEYHEMIFGPHPDQAGVFFGDWLIRGAINQGLPLNSVVSSRIFQQTITRFPELYRDRILFSIVPPEGSSLETRLIEFIQQGGKVVLYGPLDSASAQLKEMLGLALSSPLEGEMEIRLFEPPDQSEEGSLPEKIRHRPVLCGGGCREILSDRADGSTVLALYRKNSEERIAALYRTLEKWNGGAAAWVRGTNSMEGNAPESLPKPDDPQEWMDGSLLLKAALRSLGWVFQSLKATPERRPPLFTISRNLNGFRFSGFTPDTTVDLALKTPFGSPVFSRGEARVRAGSTVWRPPRAWAEECRIFLDGQQSGIVSCRKMVPGAHGINQRFMVAGLNQATLRFFPVPGTEEAVTFLINPDGHLLTGTQGDVRRCETASAYCYFEIKNVTGSLLISW